MIIDAGPLIVIDVVMAPRSIPAKSDLHVGQRRHVDAALPHLAERQLVIRVAAHQRRQIERDAQAGAAGGEQPPIALVGLFRSPEPGELPHRPQLAAVAGGVNAARIRELPRVGEIPSVVDRLDALRRVEPLDEPLARGVRPRALSIVSGD